MIKLTKYVAISLMVLMFSVGNLNVTAAVNVINVTIDGCYVNFGVRGPIVSEGRTLVPLRGVFELLGFDVDWNTQAEQAQITRDDFHLTLTVGESFFILNGERHELEVAAVIIEDRILIPIRALLESVNYSVGWNPETATVIITSPQETTIAPYDVEYLDEDDE